MITLQSGASDTDAPFCLKKLSIFVIIDNMICGACQNAGIEVYLV